MTRGTPDARTIVIGSPWSLGSLVVKTAEEDPVSKLCACPHLYDGKEVDPAARTEVGFALSSSKPRTRR